MIKNSSQLNITSLRKDALSIIDAGYQAIAIEKLVTKRFLRKNKKLSIAHGTKKATVSLHQYRRVHVIGFGKGSHAAVSVMADVLGEFLTQAIALDTKSSSRPTKPNRKVKIFFGTHPKPSAANVRATQHIVRALETLNEEDLVIFFVGGGGSSLLCGSADEMKASTKIFDTLTKRGASIHDLNIVRKHLSPVKGGALARAAYPATSFSLIVSDVCGNDFGTIASGPTVFDTTTVRDAQRVLKKFNVPLRGLLLEETPKEKKYFHKTTALLFACNQDALEAMSKQARFLGYRPRTISLAYEGNAHNVFEPLLQNVRMGEVLLLGGETTVTMTSAQGKGGRNQEAVLAAIQNAQEAKVSLVNALVASFGSDGYDNTPVAGALADRKTMQTIITKKVNPKTYLSKHNSYAFFKKIGGHIIVERKAFNVSDFMLVMKEKK